MLQLSFMILLSRWWRSLAKAKNDEQAKGNDMFKKFELKTTADSTVESIDSNLDKILNKSEKKIKNNLSVIAADNDGENETEITSSQVTERERELEARGIDREPQKPLKSSKKNERSRTGYRIKKSVQKLVTQAAEAEGISANMFVEQYLEQAAEKVLKLYKDNE